PGRRAVPASHRARERRDCRAIPGLGRRTAARARRRTRGARPTAARVAEPVPSAAVGRPGPARQSDAGADARSRRPAVRRTARRARPHHPLRTAGRPARDLPRAVANGRDGDPRSWRGRVLRRSHPARRPRTHRPGRHARGSDRTPGRSVRRALRSRAAVSPGGTRVTRRLVASVVGLVIIAAPGRASIAAQDAAPRVVVGSKSFTESVVLGAILTQTARLAGADAEHRRQIGGTRILFEALRRGEIDAYVEYTGTLTQELLPGVSPDSIEAALAPLGLSMTAPLGFNNTYAIGMKPDVADPRGIRTISDLRGHPDLVFGFGNEFMDRGDGWPALQTRYQLPQANVRGLDHDLAYRALDAGQIAATDLYSTDAAIQQYGLHVLEDDLAHFPDYKAVVLYRTALGGAAPSVIDAWEGLAGRIDQDAMIALNARAKIERVPEARAASDFLADTFGLRGTFTVATRTGRITARAREHLFLVGVALAAAILIGIPLGIIAAKRRRLGHAILATTGLVQTIPSLALLVFMIPLLGIGTWPAIV